MQSIHCRVSTRGDVSVTMCDDPITGTKIDTPSSASRTYISTLIKQKDNVGRQVMVWKMSIFSGSHSSGIWGSHVWSWCRKLRKLSFGCCMV